jgi:hypothetical protein
MAGWQRANLLAAAQYLGDAVSRSPGDIKAQVAHEGLLEVLEPVRRTIRQQRELSETVRSAVTVREKRSGHERRQTDRRRVNLGALTGVERRKTERRATRDRRSRA